MDTTEEHVPVWLSVGPLAPTNVGGVQDPTDLRQLADLLRAVADEFEGLT